MITPHLCLAFQVFVSTIICSTDALIQTLVKLPSEREQENENARMRAPLSSSLVNSSSPDGSLIHIEPSYTDNSTEDDTSSVELSVYDGSSIELTGTDPVARHETSRNRREKKIKRGGRRNRKKRRRERRINPRSNRRRACITVYRYGILTRAVDIFGDKVEVTPKIPVGEEIIDQYFHESFCDREKCRCHGTGSGVAESSCETNYRYAYARATKRGHVGWWMIRLRSGCSCVIREKIYEVADFNNILDRIR